MWNRANISVNYQCYAMLTIDNWAYQPFREWNISYKNSWIYPRIPRYLKCRAPNHACRFEKNIIEILYKMRSSYRNWLTTGYICTQSDGQVWIWELRLKENINWDTTPHLRTTYNVINLALPTCNLRSSLGLRSSSYIHHRPARKKIIQRYFQAGVARRWIRHYGDVIMGAIVF